MNNDIPPKMVVFEPRPGQARFMGPNSCKACGLSVPVNQKCSSRACRISRSQAEANRQSAAMIEAANASLINQICIDMGAQ